MRLAFTLAAGFVLVLGCATVRKEEPPRPISRAEPSPAQRPLELDPSMPGDALGQEISRQVRAKGVPGPVAFVWGDALPPPGALEIELRAGEERLSGWLVGAAHEVDMGRLAQGVRDVVVVSCDESRLYAARPPEPARLPLDLDRSSAEDQEIFAIVSLEPGDVSDAATSQDVIGLLRKLPGRVRYAVMGLPG